MSDHTHEEAQWLAQARAGSSEALGRVLEAYRDYLLLVADRELAAELRAKGGASDLVQDTFLEAQRDFAQFRGESADELRAWLRRLLLNNLAVFARRYRDTAKRQLGRELSLGDDASGGQEAALPGDTPTPSTHAMAHEQAEALSRAIARLPEEYRQVVTLRYQDRLGYEEIGRLLGRSADAARLLFTRAIARLKLEMRGSDEP
jgi:RNA polymerase sigma-70 factor (ECF subfamily)